jgi:chromosome segregation ATPase
MKFRRGFFGFKPREVITAFERMDEDYRARIARLEEEIRRVREALAETEREAEKLKSRLVEYEEQKMLISEILINAHQKARQIETEARENALSALEQVNAQIRVKEQELNILKARVEKFKEEFKEVLERYRYSLENLPGQNEEKPGSLVLLKDNRQAVSAQTGGK